MERWLATCESGREVKREVEGSGGGLDRVLCLDELSWESKSATEDDGLDASLVVAGGCVRGGTIEVGGGFFATPLGSAPPPILSCQACDDLSCSSRALIPAGSLMFVKFILGSAVS